MTDTQPIDPNQPENTSSTAGLVNDTNPDATPADPSNQPTEQPVASDAAVGAQTSDNPTEPIEVQQEPTGLHAEALKQGYAGERSDPNPPEVYTAEYQAAVARGEAQQVTANPPQPVADDSSAPEQ